MHEISYDEKLEIEWKKLSEDDRSFLEDYLRNSIMLQRGITTPKIFEPFVDKSFQKNLSPHQIPLRVAAKIQKELGYGYKE